LAKALWLVFVVFLPLIGVLVYLIARGHKMQEHAMSAAKAQDAAMREYIQQTAGSGGGASTADELTKLANLRDQGVLTPEQFEAQKAKLLA
jgi:hypothetical protein